MLCPFHVYGNWLVQMVVLVVLVTAGLTVNINVAIESQPDALVSVAVYVRAAVMFCPFHVFGNWLVHFLVWVGLLTDRLSFNTRVAIELQPLALVRLAV